MRYYRNPGTGLYLVQRGSDWFLFDRVLDDRRLFCEERVELRAIRGVAAARQKPVRLIDVVMDTGWSEAEIYRAVRRLSRPRDLAPRR